MNNAKARPPNSPAVFLNLGFRPFFAGAAVFSVLSMLAWMALYLYDWSRPQGGLTTATWHAHEMIYGYSMAVIAGFLLTAVRNWTGIQTLQGMPLLLLFLLWLAARILLFPATAVPLAFAALVDNLFIALLVIAIARPILKARQWKQTGILSKVALLLFSNLLFYAGALGIFPAGIQAGLYSGLYMVVALVLVMSRRVLPFFIENGVGYPVQLRNRTWLDVSSLLLFLVFWAADILKPDSLLVAVLAAALLVLHGLRMAGWFTTGIWHKPLLWVLYTGYGFLVLGFALKAAVYVSGISPTLALHAFAYGGIGLFTAGMLARVTIAHTGRDISCPPPALAWIFALLAIGAVIRTGFPLLDSSHYRLWIGLSQAGWIVSFSALLFICLPMLVMPRVDDRQA